MIRSVVSAYGSGRKDVAKEIQQEWVGPRSKFSLLFRYRISVGSKAVRLDAEVRAYGGAYYPWNLIKHSNSVFFSGLTGFYKLKRSGWKSLSSHLNAMSTRIGLSKQGLASNASICGLTGMTLLAQGW